MKKFIITISIIAAVIALVGGLLFSMFFANYYLTIFPIILLFFALMSIGTHTLQLHLLKKKIAKFTQYNMLITFAKMFVYAVFAIICIVADPQHAKSTVVAIMMFYLIFTAAEVISLIGATKKQKG